MHFLANFLFILPLAAVASAINCNRDNCFREIIAYESKTAPAFCSDYLAATPIQAPSPIATCGPSRISSACKCLTTATPTTSSCPAFTSAPGCPNPPTDCCKYYCGAALTPFNFCLPYNDISPYSACCLCGTPNCGLGPG